MASQVAMVLPDSVLFVPSQMLDVVVEGEIHSTLDAEITADVEVTE